MRPDPRGKSSSEADCAKEINSEQVHSEEPATAHHITSKATQAPAPVSAMSCDMPTPKDPPTSTRPDRQIPIHGSLYGVSQALDPPDPLPPGSFDVVAFTPPAASSGSVGHRAPKRPGGVVAAPPPTNPESGTSTGLTSWFSWAKEMVPCVAWLTWMKEMIVPGVTPVLAPAVPATSDDAKPVTGLNQSAEVRRVRNFVAEAPRPTDYFEERTSGYVKPVGQVIVWAASGAHQYAFEASGARSGIVTGALCKALEACNDLTRRDLWLSIKNAIELENTDRERRDLTKDVRPNRKHRVQHAELWTSQVEPLHSAAPILDKPAFAPINDPTLRDQVAPL
ncbi:hypothetical protein FRC08_016889 [Ceratobasidium sp. 394]|nr:hypothetical protein FRC08_016889 [Ceratobasidium sp. 394]